MNKMLKLIQKTLLTFLMVGMILRLDSVSTIMSDDTISTYCEYPDIYDPDVTN